MFTYDFQLSNDDRNIGTVYLPNKDAKNIPVIIYCHGWGASRQLWLPSEKICRKAIETNMALVTFDFYGCGDTGGDYSKMTYTRWKNNLSNVLSWVTSQSFANKDKIGCYSVSSGTTAALRLASEDNRIAFIVSVATCISSHIGMGVGGPAKIFADNYIQLHSSETREMFGVEFGIDFYIDTISKAPIHTIKKIQCPTLFLQGLADNPFRCADAKMAYQLMKKENLPVTYIELINGNHELENVFDEALCHMFNWFSSIQLV